MTLRIVMTLQTLALFATPITAGLLLTSPGGQVLHSASAYGVFAAALLHLAAAILLWRPGGGSPRPILYAAGFFVITLVQIAVGIAGLTTLHIPLGVLMFAGSLLQLTRLPAVRRTAVPAPSTGG